MFRRGHERARSESHQTKALLAGARAQRRAVHPELVATGYHRMSDKISGADTATSSRNGHERGVLEE